MRNNKGFTLIELLVVVAIIGILAAVGTVAYTGYTEGAKKSSAKSNHASVVKYIAAEDQKCNVGTDKAFGLTVDNADTPATGTFKCKGRTGATVATAATTALADFKNPYDTSKKAVRPNTGDTSSSSANGGYTNLTDNSSSSNTIDVKTCFTEDSECGTSGNVSENSVVVE